VVATTAAHRRQIIEAILERHAVTVLILEKILFQTVTDLDAVGELLEVNDVRAFVNCGRRTFEGYRALRSRLPQPIDVVVRGQQLGLASNGVHFLDLLEFLNDDSLVAVDTSGLDTGSVSGKRAGVVEIYGEITARLANGATLSVESLDADPTQIEVRLRAGSAIVSVDELARTQVEAGQSSTFSSQNVSETTEIYVDALNSDQCALTPYADSVRQHRHFITELRNHLGLSNADDVPCPIS
jgi:predicted dehydrogenase